jgi:hypothetical protein
MPSNIPDKARVPDEAKKWHSKTQANICRLTVPSNIPDKARVPDEAKKWHSKTQANICRLTMPSNIPDKAKNKLTYTHCSSTYRTKQRNII